MRNFVAYVFMGSGVLVMFVGGFWGLILSLRVLVEVGGFWLALAGFILFPVLFAFAPFYAGVALNDWTLLKVSYGTMAIVAVSFMIGAKVMGKA